MTFIKPYNDLGQAKNFWCLIWVILVERWINWNTPNSGVTSNIPLPLKKLMEHSGILFVKVENQLSVRRLVVFKYEGILMKWSEVIKRKTIIIFDISARKKKWLFSLFIKIISSGLRICLQSSLNSSKVAFFNYFW